MASNEGMHDVAWKGGARPNIISAFGNFILGNCKISLVFGIKVIMSDTKQYIKSTIYVGRHLSFAYIIWWDDRNWPIFTKYAWINQSQRGYFGKVFCQYLKFRVLETVKDFKLGL